MDKLVKIFSDSLQTGFFDKSILSNVDYQPELLVNQKNPPKKVLSSIIKELENCTEFYISAAFVTTSGVASIINILNELNERNVKGKIIVSQYLNFTEPEALKRLLQFDNIELKVVTKGNLHAKGYIFKNDTHYNIIVGSSNLTAAALSINKEWNLKVSALDKSGIIDRVLNEFNSDFEQANFVDAEYLLSYDNIYRKQKLIEKQNRKEEDAFVKITPNSMQIDALENLKNLREKQKNKALIISATGTGKTYLSAFDAKVFNPKRLLFVVHRLTIAKDALNTFKDVFGDTRTLGLYSGDIRDLDCDFIFSTVQTISKSEHLQNFTKEHFDYIIIDETHRSGADSYLRLLDYFEPQFLMGMTATPERTDGNDIFKLFDHNIAYEIRLDKALEEDMLSSFHYYGITDIISETNNSNIDEFNLLTSAERVNRLIEKAKFYGSDNGITRGLIFCSRKEEAKELSLLFNNSGFKTLALTGENSDEQRRKAIELLESDNIKEKLDYIFVVDIFNEGIDIPKINQIIMLRPTESAIIFIQQLGRGLRKIEEKKYLTVIDFVGNYDKNYLIPIALYGDTSYNKDTIRKLLTEGSRMIPGASTVNFDRVTKERIFKAIDSANMQLLSDLKKDYKLLKYKIGRIPMMMDFINLGSRDPFLYVNHSKSYYNFVKNNDKIEVLSDIETKLLELFSKEINNTKRIEESLILKELIESDSFSINNLKERVFNKFSYHISDKTIESCLRNLNFEFIREKKDGALVAVKEIYDIDVLSVKDGCFILSESFKSHLNNVTFKDFLLDSCNYSIYEFNKNYDAEKWNEGFVLYRKYSRKDVFRILNTYENPVPQNVGGYLVSQDGTNCPIFVNYHKADDISESTKYEDKFLNQREFTWMSKSNRKMESKDVQSILGNKGEIRLPLFIKKSNDEGNDFYYMGELSPQKDTAVQTKINSDSGKKISIVSLVFGIDKTVSDNMYNYLESPIITKQEKQEVPKKEMKADTSLVPLYNFYAAAGNFSDMQSEKDYKLIEVEEKLNPNNNYFVCEIKGESMNRVIPNGSICLFKTYTGGSRNGKVVLVENIDYQDPDFNSAFTIKTYSSIKVETEEGWKHQAIVLRPNSYDTSYKEIVLNEEEARGMRVVGEFVRIIDNG